MEIRVLRHFLEIAREENITKAAARLHISQPTLSKQMKDLETELGKKLFIRSNYSIKLTDEGMLLHKRAKDIIDLVDKTQKEFQSLDDIVGGEVHIGCAESYQIRYLGQIIKIIKKQYPLFQYHLISGNTEQVIERLDKGLLDFVLIVETPDPAKYNYLEIPESDTWGVVMRKDSPLAQKEKIYVEDLIGLDLICSEQAMKVDIPRWCGEKTELLTLSGTVNLIYNGSVFVREGLGYLLSFDHLANTGSDSELCFRPLFPPLQTKMYVVWKKHQIFSPISQRFLKEMTEFWGRNIKKL